MRQGGWKYITLIDQYTIHAPICLTSNSTWYLFSTWNARPLSTSHCKGMLSIYLSLYSRTIRRCRSCPRMFWAVSCRPSWSHRWKSPSQTAPPGPHLRGYGRIFLNDTTFPISCCWWPTCQQSVLSFWSGFLAGNTLFTSQQTVKRKRQDKENTRFTPSDSQTFLGDNSSSQKKAKYMKNCKRETSEVFAAIHQVPWAFGDFL